MAVADRGTAALPRRSRRRRGRRRVLHSVFTAVGVACILGGIALIGLPILQVYQRGAADNTALNQWNSGGSNAVIGAAPTGGPTTHTCGSTSAADFALVTFPSLATYGYAGVAGDGTWDDLHVRSMVHYAGTAGPGEKGNSIIAFHREPAYEHIDQLKVGDTVQVQDRSCKAWTYRVQTVSNLSPDQVTQQRLLGSTDGHDLTLITCTPFWIDTNRLVWRAQLVS